VHQDRHEYPEAIEEFKKAELLLADNKIDTDRFFKDLRNAFETNKERGYWEEQLKRTTQKDYDGQYYWKAVINLHLGDTNKTILLLRKSLETDESWGDSVWWHRTDDLLSDPTWDELRNDRQFKKLVDDTGLPRRR
jgi:hypothetical protein